MDIIEPVMDEQPNEIINNESNVCEIPKTAINNLNSNPNNGSMITDHISNENNISNENEIKNKNESVKNI